jgi:hypothetical protein
MMRSQIGVPKTYSLSISRYDTTVDVTLKSMSGDYACTFTGGSGDKDRFSFGPSEGYFSCSVGGQLRRLECANGQQRDLFALGQNLFGRISGNEISGTWDVSWEVTPSQGPSWTADLETTAQFGGSR